MQAESGGTEGTRMTLALLLFPLKFAPFERPIYEMLTSCRIVISCEALNWATTLFKT